MPLPPLLLADWLQSLGPLLVVVFWVVRAILSAKQNDEPDVAPRRVGPAADPLADEPALRGEAAPVKGGGAREQRAEVEEFLRKIGQLRERVEEPDGVEPNRADAGPRRRPLDPFEEPPRRVARPTPAPAPTTSDIELLIDADDAATPEPVESRPVGALADKHLPESQLAEQAAHLGERIAAADERFESRMHDKFDHRLGSLGETIPNDARGDERAEEEPSKPASSARRVAEMLSKPGGFRDAVVLSEILRRPADMLGPR